MPSVHRDCGEDITWLRRDDEPSRYLPPMEYAGEVWIQDRETGAGIQCHAYRRHNCDPDKVVAWQDYQERLAEAKGEEYTPYDAAREREREKMWEIALVVECGRCGRPVGEKCLSLAKAHANEGVAIETKNPHPQRIQAGIDYNGGSLE